MKITIVIPVYNVEAYIEDCLRSVIAQTYKGEIECVIVDDCTHDGSCDIIERFIKEYTGNIQFKLLHHDKNRGLSAARNTGIDAATGEYIYFLDSDDEITPDCIELLATPLTKKKYDFVIGDYKIVGSKFEFPPLLLEEGEIYTKEEIRSCYFKGRWYMMAWNKLCNLEYLCNEKLYFKEGLINEDELWSFQVACTARSMFAVNRNTYMYKVRKSSIIGQQDLFNRADTLTTIAESSYSWAKGKGMIYEPGVLWKALSYRENVFSVIFSQPKVCDRKRLYLRFYKRLRISPWQAYCNRSIKGSSLYKEFYNYLPGIIGYWYLELYNRLLKCKRKCQNSLSK